MDSVKADNERELTSTMDNVLSMSSKDEKNDTSDATPTSSTDANTTSTASQIVSDDPISSTSSDIVEQNKSKSAEAAMQNYVEANQAVVEEPDKSSSADPEADLLEMSISNVPNEKITEDVEDLVHDLESLLGESTDSFNVTIKRKEDRKSAERKETSKQQQTSLLEQEVSVSDDPVSSKAKEKDQNADIKVDIIDKTKNDVSQGDMQEIKDRTEKPKLRDGSDEKSADENNKVSSKQTKEQGDSLNKNSEHIDLVSDVSTEPQSSSESKNIGEVVIVEEKSDISPKDDENIVEQITENTTADSKPSMEVGEVVTETEEQSNVLIKESKSDEEETKENEEVTEVSGIKENRIEEEKCVAEKSELNTDTIEVITVPRDEVGESVKDDVQLEENIKKNEESLEVVESNKENSETVLHLREETPEIISKDKSDDIPKNTEVVECLEGVKVYEVSEVIQSGPSGDHLTELKAAKNETSTSDEEDIVGDSKTENMENAESYRVDSTDKQQPQQEQVIDEFSTKDESGTNTTEPKETENPDEEAESPTEENGSIYDLKEEKVSCKSCSDAISSETVKKTETGELLVKDNEVEASAENFNALQYEVAECEQVDGTNTESDENKPQSESASNTDTDKHKTDVNKPETVSESSIEGPVETAAEDCSANVEETEAPGEENLEGTVDVSELESQVNIPESTVDIVVEKSESKAKVDPNASPVEATTSKSEASPIPDKPIEDKVPSPQPVEQIAIADPEEDSAVTLMNLETPKSVETPPTPETFDDVVVINDNEIVGTISKLELMEEITESPAVEIELLEVIEEVSEITNDRNNEGLVTSAAEPSKIEGNVAISDAETDVVDNSAEVMEIAVHSEHDEIALQETVQPEVISDKLDVAAREVHLEVIAAEKGATEEKVDVDERQEKPVEPREGIPGSDNTEDMETVQTTTDAAGPSLDESDGAKVQNENLTKSEETECKLPADQAENVDRTETDEAPTSSNETAPTSDEPSIPNDALKQVDENLYPEDETAMTVDETVHVNDEILQLVVETSSAEDGILKPSDEIADVNDATPELTHNLDDAIPNPVNETLNSGEGISKPVDKNTCANDGAHKAIDETLDLCDGIPKPVDEMLIPSGGIFKPVAEAADESEGPCKLIEETPSLDDGIPNSVDETPTLDDEIPKPVNETADATDDTAKPTEQTPNLDGGIPNPVDETLNPDDEISKPVDDPADASDDPSKTIEEIPNRDGEIPNTVDEIPILDAEIPKLVDETADATDETAKPTEETPNLDGGISNTVDETPNLDAEIPKLVDETADATDETAKPTEEPPNLDGRIPNTVDETPNLDAEIPKPVDETADATEDTAKPAEETPNLDGGIPNTVDEALNVDNEVSQSVDETPDANKEIPNPGNESCKLVNAVAESNDQISALADGEYYSADELAKPIEAPCEPTNKVSKLEISELAEESSRLDNTAAKTDNDTPISKSFADIETEHIPEAEGDVEIPVVENSDIVTLQDLNNEKVGSAYLTKSIQESPNNEAQTEKGGNRVIEISDNDSKAIDGGEYIQIVSSGADSDSEEMVPVLALEPDENNPSPKEPVGGKDDSETEKLSVEVHSMDVAAVAEPMPEIEDILVDQGQVDEAVASIDMEENLETILAVASLQNADSTEDDVAVEPQMSEKERQEMEALRKAVESITDNTAVEFEEDVDNVGELIDIPVESAVTEVVTTDDTQDLYPKEEPESEDKDKEEVDKVEDIDNGEDKSEKVIEQVESDGENTDQDVPELRIEDSAEEVEEHTAEENAVETKAENAKVEENPPSLPDTSEDKIYDRETEQLETKGVLPDSSQVISPSEETKQSEAHRETKTRASERPKRHKKSSGELKLEELSINIDVPDKDKPYSPKVTIKPIKVPDDEVSTTSNSDTEVGKGSLKMTITKQFDKMHSILKICDPESSEAQEQDEPIPKLIIKPKMQQVEQQHSPKMSTRSSKQVYSPTSSTQRSGSPRITIKPVVKPEKPDTVSPLKIKLKTEEISKKHSPKLNIKPVAKPEEETARESIQIARKVIIKPVVKPMEEVEQVHSPRITIKPIPKPEVDKEPTSNTPRLNIKPIKKQEDEELEVEKEKPGQKIIIKPVVKPPEPDTQSPPEEDEVKERIVLKINKGNLPTPTKDPKKREHPPDDDKSEKLAKITVKFSKGGGHPHIVQQPEESNKRAHEDQTSPEKVKKQKTEVESPIATRSKHKENVVESSVETRSKYKEITTDNPGSEQSKSKQKESESPGREPSRTKHKDPICESPIEPKKLKLKEPASEMPVYESTRSRHKEPPSETAVSEATRSKQKEHNVAEKPTASVENPGNVKVTVVETKVESPIVISEDSRSQDSGSCVIVEDPKDPLAAIPVFEIRAEPAKAMTPKQETATPIPATPPTPTPRKRGRPRKVPIVVREEFKEQEEPKPEPPKSEEPLPQPVQDSGRPKRSCRGQSVRATLGIKPRKPRGPGRGRGSKRGMGTRSVPMKPERLSK